MSHLIKNVNKLLFILSCILILTSCQKAEENQFTIQVFSNVPKITIDELEAHTKVTFDKAIDYAVEQYPPVPERLLVEIVSHSGDVIIVDRTILGTAYDSEALYSLESLRTAENIVKLTNEEVPLFTTDSTTDEEIILENALRVVSIEEMTNSESDDLVAVIPKYTKDHEMAFSILEGLVGK